MQAAREELLHQLAYRATGQRCRVEDLPVMIKDIEATRRDITQYKAMKNGDPDGEDVKKCQEL